MVSLSESERSQVAIFAAAPKVDPGYSLVPFIMPPQRLSRPHRGCLGRFGLRAVEDSTRHTQRLLNKDMSEAFLPATVLRVSIGISKSSKEKLTTLQEFETYVTLPVSNQIINQQHCNE